MKNFKENYEIYTFLGKIIFLGLATPEAAMLFDKCLRLSSHFFALLD